MRETDMFSPSCFCTLSTFNHSHSATDAVVSTNHWGQCSSHLIQTTSVAKGGETKV
jgi:hypothetical protein